jgi:hypothetical protein
VSDETNISRQHNQAPDQQPALLAHRSLALFSSACLCRSVQEASNEFLPAYA